MATAKAKPEEDGKRRGGGYSPRAYRTRQDILGAAARLAQDGRRPTMAEVADEALVSRATVYRYFPNFDTLLVEAAIDAETPDPDSLFGAGKLGGAGAAGRVDAAEKALHDMVYANEPALRQFLAASLARPASGEPGRQNRRTALVKAALEPHRGEFGAAGYRNLCAALALVFGLESLVVFRDVLPLSPRRAREVKRWAIRALVAAALAEDAGSGAQPGRKRPRRAPPKSHRLGR